MSKKVKIRSHSSSKSYTIDMDELSCQCRDWTERRHVYPVNDPRRLCKHIIGAIMGKGGFPQSLLPIENTIYRIAAEGRGFPITTGWQAVRIRGREYDIFLPETQTGAWVNIYGDAGKWGYDRFEDRWSYEAAPEDEEAVLAAVRDLERGMASNPAQASRPAGGQDAPTAFKDPAEATKYLFEEAATLAENGQPEKASAIFTRLLTYSIPAMDRVEAYYCRGMCYFLMGRMQESRADIHQAAKIGSTKAAEFLKTHFR